MNIDEHAPQDFEICAMENKDQSARDESTGTIENPLAGQVATERRLQEAEQRIEDRMSAFERAMLRLTWAAVIISLLSGLVFAGQLYEMISGATATDKLVDYSRTQSEAAKDIAQASSDFTDSAYWMEEHLDDAASAMQDNVDTADRNTKTTIRNAQEAFRKEQRAWIGVLGTAESTGFTEKEIWKVKVIFFNSGRTPARNVQTSGMYTTSPVPLSGPFPKQIKQLMFRPAQSIAPQGSYREAVGSDYPAEASSVPQREGQQTLLSQYNLIKNKQLFLYYFGILKYDDNSGRHHETQYCISLANPDTKEAGFCDAFNDLN